MEEATGAPSSLADWNPKRLRASGRGGETVMTETPSPVTMLLSRHTKGHLTCPRPQRPSAGLAEDAAASGGLI